MFTLPFNHRDIIDLSTVTTFLSDSSESPSAEWRFRSDGTGQSFIGGSVYETWTWCTPTNSAYADNYQLILQPNANSTPDPGAIVYSMSGNPGINIGLNPLSGSTSGVWTFFVRRIGSTLILSSTTVSYSLDSGA
jgi:hypothetical protein